MINLVRRRIPSVEAQPAELRVDDLGPAAGVTGIAGKHSHCAIRSAPVNQGEPFQ